jgi:hypothetical protein
MPTLSSIPCWYLTIAIVWSCYQAYRGFMLQKRLTPFQQLSDREKILLLCIADGFTFLLCTFSGFLALFAFRQLAWPVSPAPTGESSAILLIFLLLYGIAGVSGKLPELLHAFKLQGH